MKKILFILSLAIGTLTFTSCEKENDLNDNPNFVDNIGTGSNSSQGTLKADFDGNEISFGTVSLARNFGTEALSGSLSPKTITITYPENPRINSAYTIDQVVVTVQYITDIGNVSGTTYTAQSGTLTIKSYDKNNSKVEGIFSGVLVNTSTSATIDVTNGEFKR